MKILFILLVAFLFACHTSKPKQDPQIDWSTIELISGDSVYRNGVAVRKFDMDSATRRMLFGDPNCKHQSDGNTYLSYPPKLRCKNCGAYY